MPVALIDAGGANLGSVRYALERLGIAPRIVRDADELARAGRIILPGVGAAAPAMAALRERGLDAALRKADVPVMGICLGMQLLYDSSEEGSVQCLGLIPGRVRRLLPTAGVRVPHMGWNPLRDVAGQPLLEGIRDGDCVYFVHGYAAPVGEDTVATCRHGETFSAIVRRGIHCGAQFHPERSAGPGARLLANFLRWQP
ncbi:glutamine amidotransferase [Luteimonas cucumeris]|uniref:Imidazole glycerol phosphate synthase subunit HisH n=1 Tax=Luteimonas cucumeris TaxID=985012 RepID=A0A562L7L3_9GAMM|nr:imidazole glycerol phosphate synthase subunit HisH [Luteimonas cucumeris]TWI03611.1 glutamine amidotransferase [Luteimonas cucumeris]